MQTAFANVFTRLFARRFIVASAGAGLCLAGLTQAVAAPAPDIVGKSVIVNWSESRDVRVGVIPRNGTVSFQLNIYLSSAGRPFARITSSSRAGSATREQVGGSGTSIGGGVSAVRTDGHLVTLQTTLGNYARSTRIEVASSGGSCSVRISLGKEAGSSPKAFQYGGDSIEVLSATMSSTSRSMQAGNAFAH